MISHIPTTFPRLSRFRAGQPMQRLSPMDAGPSGAARDAALAVRPINEGAPCKTFGVPGRATGSQTAARPTLVTPRLRLSLSGTVSPLTPGPCWHRQPISPVCRTRRGKGSVDEFVATDTTDMVSTLPARIEPQPRGQEGLVSDAIMADRNRAVRPLKRGAGEAHRKDGCAMGATKTITGVARTAFDEFIRDVQAAIRDAQITPEERALILQGAKRTNAALVAADNRMRLIRFATGDVRSIRDIEEHAARNNITPLVFDFGVEPLDAA